MPEQHQSNLNQLRKQKRAQRRALSEHQQSLHANRLARKLMQNQQFINSDRIACYLPNDGEIDPIAVLERAWIMGKQVYLPVLSAIQNSLYFAPFEPGSAICLNRFGITEPACHPKYWIKAQQLDLILLPLVAFDETGNRLGMGGGFYDRSLAYLTLRQHWKRPYLIGLAHELQNTDNLPAHSWDIPLHAIATENTIYTVKRGNQ